MTGPLNFSFFKEFGSSFNPIDPGIDPPLPKSFSIFELPLTAAMDNKLIAFLLHPIIVHGHCFFRRFPKAAPIAL
jgi:hypothetical protein